MKLNIFGYQREKGWSVTEFPKLDSERTLLMVFGAPEFKAYSGPVRELVSAYPKSKVIGCSSAGEILQNRVHDKSLSVAIVQFEHTDIRVVRCRIENAADSKAVGASLAAQLAHEDLASVFVLSDGLRVNGSELVKGLSSGLPPKVVVTGGLAADGSDFKQTWVLSGADPLSGEVVAVGLYGRRVRIGHGSQGGWDIFGPRRTITRSKDNILYEIDGKPALQIYKEYLGEKAAELPSSGLLFPLQIQAPGDEHALVRTILSVDEQSQSMTFAGNMPQGHIAQLMRANFDRLIEGASGAASLVSGIRGDQPLLCIAISCVG
ncbi:MAG: FIST C-terminal domain-containing protein, partial [Polyangiaceae bacterium]|nr:FIST C-terminal domain-containing protein [Polyangiaceae bacterium]